VTISRYRTHATCLLVGVSVGVGGASVIGSDDGGHGVAAKGRVHITTSATVCGGAAKRICNRLDVMLATLDVELGDAVTPTQSLQAEECRKV
jgi:hypothetical protein